MQELKITLVGNIVSNKNSFVTKVSNALITFLRSIPHKRLHDKSQTRDILREISRFVRLTHNTEYKNWFKAATKQILEQIKYEPFWEEVHIDFIIYFSRDNILGGDTSNKQSSIEDLLKFCNIIDDDNFRCLSYYTGKGVYRKGKGGAEIIIKKIK